MKNNMSEELDNDIRKHLKEIGVSQIDAFKVLSFYIISLEKFIMINDMDEEFENHFKKRPFELGFQNAARSISLPCLEHYAKSIGAK